MKNIEIYTKEETPGLFAIGYWNQKIGIECKSYTIHFLPAKEQRQWGHRMDYDSTCFSFGLGPFLLFTWVV